MIYKFLPLILSAFLTLPAGPNKTNSSKSIIENFNSVTADSKKSLEAEAEFLYNSLDANKLSRPTKVAFFNALIGFNKLKAEGVVTKNILTVIDFSLSSNKKRLWVIDLDSQKVLFNTFVAHGRNTGEEFAKSFSNIAESNKSSLGFYATGEIYFGKHGKSLKLDGLEKGRNDNARNRAVVMHGADYVSESFIRNHRRLGRSLGCPAIPVELTDAVINVIKDKSCLYIYHPSAKKSNLLV